MPQLLCPSFVGHADELEDLAGIATGTGAWFVAGEAGVGKSRLVREAIASARNSGITVIAGRAVDADRSALRPMSELILDAWRSGADPTDERVAPMLPVLASLVPALGEPGETPSSIVLAEAMRRLVATLPAPRMIVIEDIHWADLDSLDVIAQLAESDDLALTATLRDEPSPALQLAQRLQASRAARLVEVRPLSPSELRRMVSDTLAADELPAGLSAFIERNTDGVPFLVEELLTDAISRGSLVQSDGWTFDSRYEPSAPPTFEASVADRLARLGDEASLVLSVAAQIGREFDWTVLAPATGLDEVAVTRALGAGVQAQLIAEVEGTFRFRHALSRAAVRASTMAPQRERTAGALVRAIRQLHPELEESWCSLAARLSIEAGDPHQAATLYLESARRAMVGGALTSALELLEEARSLTGSDLELHVTVSERMLEAMMLRGEAARVADEIGGVVRELRAIEAPDVRIARAHLTAARAAVNADAWTTAAEHLAEASACSDGTDPSLDCRLQLLEAHLALAEERNRDALDHAASARDQARVIDDPATACEALEIIGRVHRLGDLDRAREAFDGALTVATAAGDRIHRARALHELGTVEVFELARVASIWEARQVADEVGDLRLSAVIDAQLASALMVRSEFDSAAEVNARGIALSRRLGLQGTLPLALALDAMIVMVRPDRADFEARVEAAIVASGDDPMIVAILTGTRGAWALFNEERALARRALDEGVELTKNVAHAPPAMYRCLHAMVRALADDDPGAAIEAASTPDYLVMRAWRGVLIAAEAVMAGRAGDLDAAERHAQRWADEFGELESEGHWYHLSARLMAEAAIDDGWGTPVPWLTDAEAYFAARGGDALAAACRGLLARAGVKQRRRGRGESDVPASLAARGVTSREVDVLRLLPRGMTNKEIGERLYLSPRTVGGHVARMLQKLGVENRSSLAAIATAEGLASPETGP